MESVRIFLSTSLYIIECIIGLIFFYLIRIFFKIEDIGILGTLVSFFMIFSFIFNLGFNFAHLKFFSEATNPDEEAKCNSTFLFYKIIQNLIYIIVIIILIPINPVFKFNHMIVYLFFIGKLLNSAGRNFLHFIYLNKKEVLKIAIPELSSTILKLILLISLINIFIADIWLLMYIYLLTDLFFFIFSLSLLKKFNLKGLDCTYLLKYFKYSLPFFIITSLTYIITWIDLTLISFWFSLEEVANYFTAKEIFTFIILSFNFIQNILIPTFSKNIATGKNDENLKIIKKVDRILTLIVVPIVFLIILYSTKLLVFIFGDDYKQTGLILSILSLNIIIFSIENAMIVQLMALGQVNLLAKIAILKTSIILVLIIIFGSPLFLNMGILGVSLAIVFSEFITQIIYRPIVYKKYGLGFHWNSFKNITWMFCIYLIQTYINAIFNYSIFFIIIFILFDLFLYFLFLYLFKVFTKEDLKFLMNLIKIDNIKNQILMEFKK